MKVKMLGAEVGGGGVFFWVGFDGEGSKVPGSPDQ